MLTDGRSDRGEVARGGSSPVRLGPENPPTETIDLDNLYLLDRGGKGGFSIREIEGTSLGKLLHALPIPALLVNDSYEVSFLNEASANALCNAGSLCGEPFKSIFSIAEQGLQAQAIAEKVFRVRRLQVSEALLGADGQKLWCRLSMRTVRIGHERYVLVLAEDLTLQKKQILLQRRQEEELRRAHDALEKRVQERTNELSRTNVQLRREVAARRRTQSKLELSAKIIESSGEAVVCMDLQGTITQVNQAFCRITEYSRDEVIGRSMNFFPWGRVYSEFYQEIWQTVLGTGEWQGEAWDRRKNGQLYPTLLSMSAVKSDHGTATHYVAIFSDITRVKQVQKHLERLAHYDHLTRLPNRLLFHERLQQAILLAQRQNKMVGIMLLDLDRFKNINDTLGHRFGDRVLIEVAERLKRHLRLSDTPGRVGGDEFVVLLPGISTANGAATVARNLIEDFSRPLSIEGREIFMTASIGIAVYPIDGDSVDGLLRNADTALHYAKERGKNGFQFFSQKMNDDARKRQRREQRLRVAFSRGQFLLHYQPILDLGTGQIIALEALLRWRHPARGAVSAAKLIPLAEETGLIVPIGEWVLRTACEQNRQWQEMGLPAIRVAVNLSGRQLKQKNIARHILHILGETGLDPRFLEIELTESVMVSDADETVRLLEQLKENGVSIAIDDFGTGYSSLNYLRKFPVDRLKIDQSFVKNIISNSYDQALVKAIVAVAHSRNIKVAAEGVENKEQLAFLRLSCCDEVQGFLLGRPASDIQIAGVLEIGRHIHSSTQG